MASTTQIAKTTATITVSLSRFCSMTPVAALELYSELAIISETPVPLPECIRDERDKGNSGDSPNDEEDNLERTHEVLL